MSDSQNDFADLQSLARRSGTAPVWLRVGQLIDGISRTAARDVDIILDAKRIHFVGPAERGDAEKWTAKDAPDLTLPNHTALPGLIEAHAHAFLEGAPIDPAVREQQLTRTPESMLARARSRWPKIMKCGIGAVRDAGDKFGVGLALAAQRKQSAECCAATPWIDSPGAAIYHRGRYGAFMGEPIEDHPTLEACVAARVRDGADRIKLLVSGIINFKAGRVTAPPQMSTEEVAGLVRAAKHHNRPTFAHASGADGVENSIEGGVDTVEHGFFVNDEQLRKMRDRDIAWVPTFAPVQLQIDRAADLGWSEEVVGHLRQIIDSHQRMLRRAETLGVKVLCGSDAGSCGVPHGIGFLDELCHMETAGMSTMAILRAATGISAQMLRFPEPIGQLAPDFRSRLILTAHDPLRTVSNLRKPKIILFDGEAIESPAALSLEGL